jgi:hypothetical protein
MNRLQKGLINSRIALRLNYQKKFFLRGTHNFFYNSNRDFYSENNNVSQVYTYILQIQKKNVKNATMVYTPFCANHWPHICPYVIFCYLFFQLT